MVTVAARETGVILWANPQRGVAVIWCADQQRLAYHASGASMDEVATLAAGDLVSFTSRLAKGLRLAEGLTVIQRAWHPELVEALRKSPEKTESARPRRRAPYLRAL